MLRSAGELKGSAAVEELSDLKEMLVGYGCDVEAAARFVEGAPVIRSATEGASEGEEGEGKSLSRVLCTVFRSHSNSSVLIHPVRPGEEGPSMLGSSQHMQLFGPAEHRMGWEDLEDDPATMPWA